VNEIEQLQEQVLELISIVEALAGVVQQLPINDSDTSWELKRLRELNEKIWHGGYSGGL
jgi:hypothetical protein